MSERSFHHAHSSAWSQRRAPLGRRSIGPVINGRGSALILQLNEHEPPAVSDPGTFIKQDVVRFLPFSPEIDAG